jgi:hypothetical protein
MGVSGAITRMNLQKAVIPVIPVTAVVLQDYVQRGQTKGSDEL